MTTIFAPAPPTAEQLDVAYRIGMRIANDFWPVVNYDALLAKNAAARLRFPADGAMARTFDGVQDCLAAMRQVQKAKVTA